MWPSQDRPEESIHAHADHLARLLIRLLGSVLTMMVVTILLVSVVGPPGESTGSLYHHIWYSTPELSSAYQWYYIAADLAFLLLDSLLWLELTRLRLTETGWHRFMFISVFGYIHLTLVVISIQLIWLYPFLSTVFIAECLLLALFAVLLHQLELGAEKIKRSEGAGVPDFSPNWNLRLAGRLFHLVFWLGSAVLVAHLTMAAAVSLDYSTAIISVLLLILWRLTRKQVDDYQAKKLASGFLFGRDRDQSTAVAGSRDRLYSLFLIHFLVILLPSFLVLVLRHPLLMAIMIGHAVFLYGYIQYASLIREDK